MYKELNGTKSSPKFRRTSSQICPAPDVELLEAVLKNETDKIRRIILSNRHLLSHIYTPEYNKTVLLIACSEDGVEAKTVKTLLNLGANPRDFSETDGWEALHFAAYKTDSEILNVLLEKNPGDVNTTAKGSNALHILIRHGNAESEEFLKCAELLIKKGINVNLGDANNVSPILCAAKKGYKHIIKLMLDVSVVPVDLDTHQLRGKTARNVIISQNLYDGILPPPVDNSSIDGKEILFSYVKAGNEDAFVNFENGHIRDFADCVDSTSTLLQVCCERGLDKAVLHLLQNGADPNRNTCKNILLPIEIAAENGNSKIFETLIEWENIKIPSTVLISLLKYIDDDCNSKYQCYKLLMRKIKKQSETRPDEVSAILNHEDNSSNTPLHYAIRYADKEIIRELLDLGASLGAKNKYGVMPIQDIEPEALEKHLDNCVSFDMQNKKIDKEDFAVTFVYRSLIPPYVRSKSDGYVDDIEAASFNVNINRELVAETEVISYMSKASEFKHLLKHPVIVSFLFMKWLRIQWLFWTNLIFYILFSLSLVVYIFAHYTNFSNEEKSVIHNIFIQISYAILVLSFLLLLFREVFQICVAPKKYFKNFENYIEIILIVLTGMIIFVKSPSDDLRKQLSSLSILLAAFELVLMLGQHPYFSTNVVMFRTVSFNFFRFLIWYSLLIIAFALSFYILFTTDNNGEPTTRVNQTDQGEDNLFNNPGKSVFKTVIMLTGEFDAGSINFETFPVTSKIIFALFIFMIAIILLNLLNGLAVSDTQMIKNDAELVGHIARAQHIRYVESMLVGNIIPVNVLKKINNFCCCLPMPDHWKCKITQVLAKDACLFPKYLNYELVFYPNKSGLISLPGVNKGKTWSICKSCAACTAIYLDRDTIRRTNNIVEAKRNEKVKREDCQLGKIEYEINELKKKMDSLLRYLEDNGNF
ncbi:transient receptor potential cation channel protein painless [Cylas formicarius]|uniref:transient receptor potential cation channel protein painless n=1 Tax=Cylas formicarius TaxID=197179 RepID=UPI0029584597|nr:transient receptor potential cation channel protein painless [Cylas formicarius]XP_060530430.1 transient receptor potential cation channel protein painless [Cylas formicarius]XP_060530431.1 transient receptor potential cation channel protein painless [Cylas formicarius]